MKGHSMCSRGDNPVDYPDPVSDASIRAMAEAMTENRAPEWPVIEQAELFLLRLSMRGWLLVRVDEPQP